MSKILVVDSSLLDRKRIRGILEAAGHEVTEIDSPHQAMAHPALHQKEAYQLLITELVFPNHDGLSFIRTLKAHQPTAMTPVLVVSGQNGKEDLFAAIQAGASNMVAKPFGGDLLLRRVTETLAEGVKSRQGDEGALTWRISDYLVRETKRCDRTGSALSLIVGRVSPHDPATMTHVMTAVYRMLRATDILARLGEDGVVLILPDTDRAGVRVLQDRLTRTMASLGRDDADRPALRVELRLGAATYPTEGADSDALLQLAEERVVS